MHIDDAEEPERDATGAEQEPWDYARFVETYNALARARGGWMYEADGRTPEEMRERYERGQEFPDIWTFAEGLFIWEQSLNL